MCACECVLAAVQQEAAAAAAAQTKEKFTTGQERVRNKEHEGERKGKKEKSFLRPAVSVASLMPSEQRQSVCV